MLVDTHVRLDQEELNKYVNYREKSGTRDKIAELIRKAMTYYRINVLDKRRQEIEDSL